MVINWYKKNKKNSKIDASSDIFEKNYKLVSWDNLTLFNEYLEIG